MNQTYMQQFLVDGSHPLDERSIKSSALHQHLALLHPKAEGDTNLFGPHQPVTPTGTHIGTIEKPPAPLACRRTRREIHQSCLFSSDLFFTIKHSFIKGLRARAHGTTRYCMLITFLPVGTLYDEDFFLFLFSPVVLSLSTIRFFLS